MATLTRPHFRPSRRRTALALSGADLQIFGGDEKKDMSDQEGYDSEEDLDYVPSEGEQASEEENSGDEEDLSLLKDDDTEIKETSQKRKSKTNKKNNINTRKRRGGIKLDENDGDKALEGSTDTQEDNDESNRRKELAEQIAIEEENKRKENEKKRADDLWSNFMSGVKLPPKVTSSSGTLATQIKVSNGDGPRPKSEDVGSGKTGKITITKIFDFAGEEVKVTEEVDADSKEAKAEQKKQEKPNEETLKSSTQPSPCFTGAGLKRPAVSGLGNVLSKINKKSKMGTLEKSKIDWDSFKRKEGIDEDLKIYNKGKQGYTERMAFLNRADQRQYEIERDLRLGSTSKR